MSFRKLFLADWPLLLLIVLSLGLSLFAYPHLPARIPVHWGLNGQPNRYGPPWTGAFMPGLLALGIYLLFCVLPLVDPRQRNYQAFLPLYRLLRWLVVLITLLTGGLTLSAGLGYHPPVGTIVRSAVALLILITGNFLGKVQPNWFVGIRTPWTLASEEVWHQTHRLAAPLWVAGGIVLLAISFLPSPSAALPYFACLAVLVLVPIVHSYLVWARLPKK